MKTDEQYSLIFKTINSFEISNSIEERVMRRIQSTKLRRAKMRIFCFGITSILASIGSIPVIVWLITAAKNSGFYEYASLLISDSAVVFANWKLFISSMAESMPIFEMTLTLGIIFVFVYALRSIAFAISSRNNILHSVILN
jgi:hypothetical protein